MIASERTPRGRTADDLLSIAPDTSWTTADIHLHQPGTVGSWCHRSTYIGASAAVVEQLLLTPGIEAWATDQNHRITWDADRLNSSS